MTNISIAKQVRKMMTFPFTYKVVSRYPGGCTINVTLTEEIRFKDVRWPVGGPVISLCCSKRAGTKNIFSATWATTPLGAMECLEDTGVRSIHGESGYVAIDLRDPEVGISKCLNRIMYQAYLRDGIEGDYLTYEEAETNFGRLGIVYVEEEEID